MNFNIFAGAGLYLYNPEPGMDQREFVRRFKEAGGTWIAFLLQEGKQVVGNAKNQQLISICKEMGVAAVGSSWMADDPIEEAKISKELAVNLDGWIPNGENTVTYSQPWGHCAECFGRTGKWMAVWGMMRPTMFSSYTHFSNHDIDYWPFVSNGCFAGPQCYANDFGPLYDAYSAIPNAYDVKQPWNGYRGFESNRIAPTMGIANSRYPVDMPGWLNGLADIRVQYPGKGFSFWPGELVRNIPNFWDHLENAIKVRELARYPGDQPEIEPPLTSAQMPYTGPYYGPTTNKPKRKGPTAKALKMAMHQGGYGSFATPDEHFNLNLEKALRRYQASRGILATGNYGKGTWEALRKERMPNGKRMMPDSGVALIKKEATS